MSRLIGIGGLAIVLGFASGLPGQFKLPGPLQPSKGATGYAAPKAVGPVVELFDENLESFVAELTHGGSPVAGKRTINVERVDVFAGLESVRVDPSREYHTHMAGWSYKIVEHPKNDGEYRYIRFTWKKKGGGSILVAFACDGGHWTGKRYSAGPFDPKGSGHRIGEATPIEWTIVTRDLFKDFGAMTLDGLLLSVSIEGNKDAMGYFDHMVLGRTEADLERATAASLGRLKPAKPLTEKDREALWADLIGLDRDKACLAFRTFLATAPEHVAFMASRLPRPDPNIPNRIEKLLAELDADDYRVREQATAGLYAIGQPAVARLQMAAVKSPSAEVRKRAGDVLRVLNPPSGEPTREAVMAARLVRVLERADSPPARDLLERLGQGDYGVIYASAVAARARPIKP